MTAPNYSGEANVADRSTLLTHAETIPATLGSGDQTVAGLVSRARPFSLAPDPRNRTSPHMATFHPDIDNIKRMTVPPTEGERHLLEILRDKLDDSYEVYFNPFLDGDRPDLIVLKPGCGVLIIEVKDWNLERYRLNIRNQWHYQKTTLRSPSQQVFRYKENLFNLHLPLLGLQHLANRNFYRLISVAVYFHCAKREQINWLYKPPFDEINDRIQQLNKDQKQGRIGQAAYDQQMDRWEHAQFKLSRDQNMSWGIDTVAKKVVQQLEKMGRNPLFSPEIHEDFRRRLRPPVHVQQQGLRIAFDAKQQALTTSRPGFAKVKGVAGSGKTTVLAQRAINAHRRHGGQVLILTYNITLRHYIRDTISRLQGGGNQQQFEIIHYHGFVGTQLNNCGVDFAAKQEELAPALSHDMDLIFGMKSLFTGVETEKYPTILIDEVQDYRLEWIKLVRDCFLAEGGEMVLFGDQFQNIYDRPSGERESAMVLGFGRWISLTKSYRSRGSSPLFQLFRNFQLQYLIGKYADSEVFATAEPMESQRSMDLDLLSYETCRERFVVEDVIGKIKRYIQEYRLHPNDIAIVSSKVEWLIPLNEALKQSEKTKVMFEEAAEIEAIPAADKADPVKFRQVKEMIRRRKKCFFMQNSGLIKLSTTHSFKGLEAQTVFCLLTPDDEAEMVYTAITRAQRNLVVFDTPAGRFRSFFVKQLRSDDEDTETCRVKADATLGTSEPSSAMP